MSINLEQIDLLRERANVSYQDAKDALEKCNYDLVEALVYLEKEDKIKSGIKDCCTNNLFDKSKKVIQKGNTTKFIIKKKENTILNIPLTAAVIITVIAPPAALIGIPAALITNHKIRLEKQTGEDLEVNKVFDKMSTAVTNVTSSLTEKKVDIE
jgi:hypothetical protein